MPTWSIRWIVMTASELAHPDSSDTSPCIIERSVLGRLDLSPRQIVRNRIPPLFPREESHERQARWLYSEVGRCIDDASSALTVAKPANFAPA